MTTKHVVADDLLGQISRKVWELLRRILEGSVDPVRTMAIMQLAFEGVPQPLGKGSSEYLLESRWSWDNSHQEFATIGLEECDSDVRFEDILDPTVSAEKKDKLLAMLRRIYEAQVPAHGGRKMLRLYRVCRTTYFGYSPGHGLDGRLEQDAVDIHFMLRPLFDFNDDGQLVPCQIGT
ncbi:MAG: hypothetical protein AAB817_02810 [Patescibacteria group bacterium]